MQTAGERLKVGDKAPDFSLPDQNGNIVSLADGVQKNVWQVVYFYPMASTRTDR